MKPLMTVFGLVPGSKFYIPHYQQVPFVYPNARIRQLNSNSVMFTRNAWQEVDFWNSDADIMYAEDSLSFNDALNTSGNHFAYFEPFLKLYRVAHSDVTLKGLGHDKNDNHVLDIFHNFIRSDLIWISPILKDRMRPFLKRYYSEKIVKHIENKSIVLPYPSYYKAIADVDFDDSRLRIKGRSPVFLWNHRLVANKNFKDFCWILEDFKKRFCTDFKILFVCGELEKTIMAALPKSLHENAVYKGFISDRQEYLKTIRKANFTIATSKLEGFGSAVFDCIANGILLINQDCNDALVSLIGGEYTYPKEKIADRIHKAMVDKGFRQKLHRYNIEKTKAIPSARLARKTLRDRISELVQKKMDTAPTLERSEIVKTALKAIGKRPLTKRELYKAVGWTVSTTPLNSHWARYYYALRREGVETTVNGHVTYYHIGSLDTSELKKLNKPSKGLFQ
jgi:glycosyltransferase involved in cell wall biosynthesis